MLQLLIYSLYFMWTTPQENKNINKKGWDDSLAAVQTDIKKRRMWTAVREEEDCGLVKDARVGLWRSLSACRADSNSLIRVLHTVTHVHAQTHSPTCLSFHCKAAGLLDRRQQLVVQLVVALVGWNVNPIEAGERRETERWVCKNEAMRFQNILFAIIMMKQSRVCKWVCVWSCMWHTPGMGFG